MNTKIFDELESNVRSYCRTFPTVFSRAKGACLYNEEGKRYIDFFAGAGALNYGHNNDAIKRQVLEYLSEDNVLHALDMYTPAKRNFLETFQEFVLAPKNLKYKIQFTGPTGTNAVEAALKIARRVKGRPWVWAFSGGYHGMSLGALAVTANAEARQAAGMPLAYANFLPFASDTRDWESSIAALEQALSDGHSGHDKPAAIILETVQAEGGINVAPTPWLQALQKLCRAHDVLLIVDDIQVGCYRTGQFFSFEESGIQPDMVLLSKSIGGLGFPMSLLLMRPELDIWSPGEHTGTFRGNQIAFVAGAAALRHAQQIDLPQQVASRAAQIHAFLEQQVRPLHPGLSIRGRGLIWGIDMRDAGGANIAKKVSRNCFDNGLIIERAGRQDTVLKILPPLTLSESELQEGLDILARAMREQLEGL